MAEPFRTTLGRVRVNDGISNFESRVGLGTDNQMSRSSYTIQPLSRQRIELDAMYRSSWVVRQAVGVIPADMTRAGVTLKGTEEIDKLQNALRRLSIWQRLSEAMRWGRLYGGCIAVMLIDGQRLSEPLDPARVGRGAFRGLAVLDRWVLQPSTNLVGKFGPNWSKPEHYRVIAGSANMPSELTDGDIHHSRVLRFEGDDLPYYQRAYEMGWGMSVVEPFHDRLVAFDSTTMGMAQMVYRAHLRTIKVKNLRKTIADGGKQFDASIAWIDMVRRWQTLEGLTVLDGEDDFQTTSYAFGGLPEVLVQMSQQIAGAIGMPIVKLFGMSPAGFSTGDTDLRSYYDNIALRQESELRHPFEVLLSVLYVSELGVTAPAEFGFDFAPLWQMSQTEKATVAASRAGAVINAEMGQIITPAIALKELQAVGRDTGTFATITDEDIEKAEAAAQTEAPPEIGDVDPSTGEPVAGESDAQATPDEDADGTDGSDREAEPGAPPDFLRRPRLVAGAGMQGL